MKTKQPFATGQDGLLGLLDKDGNESTGQEMILEGIKVDGKWTI